ncbi:hypothetical protein, partial [Pseudomonas aeruginosa]
ARQPAATRGAGQQGERLEQRSAPRVAAGWRAAACLTVRSSPGSARASANAANCAWRTVPGST